MIELETIRNEQRVRDLQMQKEMKERDLAWQESQREKDRIWQLEQKRKDRFWHWVGLFIAATLGLGSALLQAWLFPRK